MKMTNAQLARVNKLHKLLNVALADARHVIGNPPESMPLRFDHNLWLQLRDEQNEHGEEACAACLAGLVMLRRMSPEMNAELRRDREFFPARFPELINCLAALDYLRRGNVFSALHQLHQHNRENAKTEADRLRRFTDARLQAAISGTEKSANFQTGPQFKENLVALERLQEELERLNL